MDPISFLFLTFMVVTLLLAFVGFMVAVWQFNCYYVFPIFGKIAKGTFNGTVRGTVSLNEKLKPLASFWLLGISLAAIFILSGIAYGSNILGATTASVTANTHCAAPVPVKDSKADHETPQKNDIDRIEAYPN